MFWAVLVSVFVAVIAVAVAVAVVLHMRWVYGKLTARHTSIAYLLAMTLSRRQRVLNKIRKLKKDSLPEFLEDFRESLAKDKELAPALPQEKADAEFVIYLTLRILFSGAGKEALIAELPSLLYLSPAVKKALERQSGA